MNLLKLRILIVSISLLSIIPFQNANSQQSIKIMYYNVLNYPGSTAERVSYFKTINQYVKPDILLVNQLGDYVTERCLLLDDLPIALNFLLEFATDPNLPRGNHVVLK